MSMTNFILRYRRQRAADRVVKVGRKRRDLIVARTRELETDATSSDIMWLDAEIERLSRQRDKLIDFLKNTPAV